MQLTDEMREWAANPNAKCSRCGASITEKMKRVSDVKMVMIGRQGLWLCVRCIVEDINEVVRKIAWRRKKHDEKESRRLR